MLLQVVNFSGYCLMRRTLVYNVFGVVSDKCRRLFWKRIPTAVSWPVSTFFLSCMTFTCSIYEVICVACKQTTGCKQTNDSVKAKSHTREKPLLDLLFLFEIRVVTKLPGTVIMYCYKHLDKSGPSWHFPELK